MGNYASCNLSVAIIESQSQGPKVILPNGATRQLSTTSTTAAELMLDHPGYFMVHSAAVLDSRRLLAVPADEELELGAVYAMFPMARLGSVARAEDMRWIILATGKGNNKVILDSTTMMTAAPSSEPMRNDVPEDIFEEYMYMKSLSRSKRPTMDTIKEEVFH